MPPDIKSLTREEIERQLQDWREPAFRAAQLLDWLHAHRAADWDALSNLPKTLREKLRAHFTLQTLALVRAQDAPDATRKFLWRLADGALIESVLLPASPALHGEAGDRRTLCLSTQVGCAYGCKFCASGLHGWQRNLEPHEIIEQVHAAERVAEEEAQGARHEAQGGTLVTRPPSPTSRQVPRTQRLIDNLVIMGMGEPLANYDNLLRALKILNAPWGGGVGARKITISTSGLAPQIRRLAGEPFQFRLAISLHGATDEIRNRIMPVNRKYPLAELTAACADYQRRQGRMLTLEYILLAGVNDAPAQAAPLAALARPLHAKINLIPYNPVPGLPWTRPDEAACERFHAALAHCGVTATLRREKGGAIAAACGQLRLQTIDSEAAKAKLAA